MAAVTSDGRPPDDSAGFSSWVDPHLAAMRTLARRLAGADADDAVQDALERAWRHRRRFDPSLGTPGAWLLAIVANESRRRMRRATEPLLTERAQGEAVHDAGIDVDMERAIRALSRQQRLVIELYYYVDLPIAEVAAALRIAPGTVKSTLSDARARLAQLLKVDA